MIHGQSVDVTVNGMMPTERTSGIPHFLNARNAAYWPLVLHKAYAKIVGNYKAMDGGTPWEVLKAATGAPVTLIDHRIVGRADIWRRLNMANTRFHVMTATTPGGMDCTAGLRYGLLCGQTYSILWVGLHSTAF